MVRFLVIFALVVAAAAALPMEDSKGSTQALDRRQLGGLNGIGGIGGGIGGIGGMGGAAGFNSISSVQTGYSSLISQISATQAFISQGSISSAMAIQRLQLLAGQFQNVFGGFNQCGGCGGAGIGQLSGVFQQTFSAFYQLITTCQSTFGGGWSNMFSTAFGPFNGMLSTFFQRCQGFGLNVGNFMPSPLIPVLPQIGFSSAGQFFQSQTTRTSSHISGFGSFH